MRVQWLSAAREPSLKEILEDPITQAVMRSDGIDADQVYRAALAARWKLRHAPVAGRVA